MEKPSNEIKKCGYQPSFYLVIINSLIVSVAISLMCHVELTIQMDYALLAKFILMSLTLFYLLLSAGLKELRFKEDRIEFYYYLRPFARYYIYRYNDVCKVIHDCSASAGAFHFFKIVTNRNCPFFFFKRKYLYFINKSETQAKSIIKEFKRKGVEIILQGPESTKEILEREED